MNLRKIDTCPPYIKTAPAPLNRDVYSDLPQDRKNIIQNWFYRASERCGCVPRGAI